MKNTLGKHFAFYILTFLFFSCQNFGQLKVIADLPSTLKEVSGIEYISKTRHVWVINDGGNKSELYKISKKGEIKKEINIKSKNKDWEDITSDNNGNLYIGDFGNNGSYRKDLRILFIRKKQLKKKSISPDKIHFSFENQENFPPKKERLYFDCEAFFYFKNYLYLFTKSRVPNKFGTTFLYKIPAVKGNHKAKLIGEFNNGTTMDSWITAADISKNGKKVVLLSQKNILVFTDFKNDNFFSGKLNKIKLESRTQKEGICFKNKNTLLLTDEKSNGEGGNLYELKIN